MNVLNIFVFLFTALVSTQVGKHFFFSYSYLSGIRIDYLAPTLYVTDIFSLVCIYYFMSRCVIPAKAGIQTIILQFKKGNLRLDPCLHRDDNGIYSKYFYSGVFCLIFIFLLITNYFFALSKPLWVYSAVRAIQWISIFYYFKQQAQTKTIFSSALAGFLLGAGAQLSLALQQLADRTSIQGLWYYLGERSFSSFTPGIAKAYFLGHEFLRPYGTFSHPNSLAGFYLLFYSFILTQKRVTNLFLKMSLLTLSSFLIFISFSRTAIIVYVFITFIYFLINNFSCRLCLLAKVIIASILLFFVFSISGDSQGFAKRNDFAEKAIAIIGETPFSGVGMGSYLIAQHAYPQKFSTFFEQPVHNILLLAVSQIGIPLSVLLTILIIRIIRIRAKDVSFMLPILVVVLTGCMDHYWLTLQQNVLLTAVIFGMIKSYETKTSRS